MVNERRQNFLSLSELERGSKEFTSSETQGQIIMNNFAFFHDVVL